MADTNGTQAIFTKLCENRNRKARRTNSRLTESGRANAVRRAVNPAINKKSSFLRAALENVNTSTTADGDDVEMMDDIIDNVAVVVDPEKNIDDLEVRADAVQAAIDDTPEGEIAFSDEYVGDTIYACPVCGQSFFADAEYHDGDACPICKAEPSGGFLVQGVVESTIDDNEDEFRGQDLADYEDESDIDMDTDDEDMDAEDADVEDREEDSTILPDDMQSDDEDEDESKKESYRRYRSRYNRRSNFRRY